VRDASGFLLLIISHRFVSVIPGRVVAVSRLRIRLPRVTQSAEHFLYVAADTISRTFVADELFYFSSFPDWIPGYTRLPTTIMSLNTAHVQGGGCLIHAGEW